MKLLAIAVIGIIACSAASAETVAIGTQEGCVPAFSKAGPYIDASGTALTDTAGWLETPNHEALTAEGRAVFTKDGFRVFVDKPCTGNLARAQVSGMGLVGALGLLVLGLSAVGTSSTN
jgi:hypothetical protein